MRLQVCLAESLAIGSFANCRLVDVVNLQRTSATICWQEVAKSEAVPAVLLPFSLDYQTIFFATAYN
jgi:hypothetical protein